MVLFALKPKFMKFGLPQCFTHDQRSLAMKSGTLLGGFKRRFTQSNEKRLGAVAEVGSVDAHQLDDQQEQLCVLLQFIKVSVPTVVF
jgi:hypothetical protein